MNLIYSTSKKIIFSIGLVISLNSGFANEPDNNSQTLGSNDTVSHRNMQISFVPYFGTDGTNTDNAVTDISINILAGYINSVNVAEFGGLVNIVRQNAGKCQIAGIGNVVGNNSSGFQAAGIFNTAKNLEGVQVAGNLNNAYHASGIQISGLVNQASKGSCIQLAGLVNNAGEAAIFQIAGLVNNTPKTDNFQIAGLVNNATDAGKFQISGLVNRAKITDNFQIAGLVNHSNIVKDAQIAGLANITLNATKVQISGLVNHAPFIESAQIAGLVNNSESVTGVQISGLINRAKYFKGAQIGVLNIADSCDGVPIGVLSFVKNGYHKLEIASDEVFYTNIAFRTGVKKFHTILTAGIRPDELNYPLWTYGAGVGTAVEMGSKTDLDINLYFQNVVKGSRVDNNYLYRFYTGIDRHFSRNISISLGLTYNFLVTDTWQPRYTEYYSDIAPYSFSENNSHRFNLKSWAGFKVGIRFF
jgi:hypothetical protein